MKKILFGLLALLASANFVLAQSPFPQNIKVNSTLVANNTTAVVIKASAGTVYAIEAFNNTTTVAYLKLYNAATATCGSGTPVARYMIPAMAVGTFGGNLAISIPNGDAYGLGIAQCVVTGYADNDATAPAANLLIVNIHYN